MDNKITIGARGSKLSLAYANKVRSNILSQVPGIDKEIIIKTIKTSGDLFQNKKISEIGGKDLFCKEIEEKLIKKEIDIAVHSLKDMDSEETKGLTIHAYLKRNDARETFVSKSFNKISDIKKGKIGSSSKRRELQIKLLNKDIKVESIRGNVDTRIEKIERGEYDGAILALAGLETLNLENHIKQIFSLKEFIPTAGQGLLLYNAEKTTSMLKNFKKINHTSTEICVS